MARPEKVAVVDEVREKLSSSAATLLTDYRGLSVTELAQLRARLREANATYRVVKNTLTRRAADDVGIAGLAAYLEGPTALVFCDEDPVGPAKALRDFAREHPELLVKAGFVEGEVLDEQATIRLADLESREELLARLAGLFSGALANFARLLNAPLEQQARLVQALIDAGGVEAKGFSPTAPETAGDGGDGAPSVAERAADATASAVEAAADVVEAAAATAADAADTVTEAVAGEEAGGAEEPEAGTEEADETS